MSRLRNDLMIISDPSLEESNACTMLFSNFYKEPKMETLSIEFNNVTISLQKEMGSVSDSKLIFCPSSLRMNETLSINGNDLLNNYDCLKFDSNKIFFFKIG
ncbi:hypothetical protein Wxf_03239 [Armadillidium vulgare]|nr:hypothetical protein Wxf_03239 [Armadillidium vulgare] [Wolbachia endosymbiont of Armadillidium vulgare]